MRPAICLFLTGLCAVIAHGDTINPLGQASTSAFIPGALAGDTARGWDFIVNADGVSVVQLGVNAAINTSLTLTLWDDAARSELAQITVASSASRWVFGNLASPVSLTHGRTYSVIGWANTPGIAAWYLLDNNPPALFEPTGAIQYVEGRYLNAAGPNTFPTGMLSGQYGVTDIGYSLTSAPEPVTVLLAGAALALLLAGRRRAGLLS